MKAALHSVETYENFVYAIRDRHPEIVTSTLVVVRRGPHRCQVQGELQFDRNIVLHVYERLDFIDRKIAYYSYEVHQEASLLYWYDPQPHPADVTLAFNHPHHAGRSRRQPDHAGSRTPAGQPGPPLGQRQRQGARVARALHRPARCRRNPDCRPAGSQGRGREEAGRSAQEVRSHGSESPGVRLSVRHGKDEAQAQDRPIRQHGPKTRQSPGRARQGKP